MIKNESTIEETKREHSFMKTSLLKIKERKFVISLKQNSVTDFNMAEPPLS